ncbi:MAG: Gfo/Idh/MocA family oxidoreductase [Victivallales bacterium]|nr:Gfo/Idh/MocA family oxidoreductase [Victivallales bacterium]
MKKKIGLIDLHIDEFHANHYPDWFKAAPSGDGFEIAGAWEESAGNGVRDLAAWSKDMGIKAFSSLEELIAECDCLCVLAPSNPETHLRLAELPLKSGKDVFIDKPFAPDRKSAEKLFEMADQGGCRLFSSSALRFGGELSKIRGTFPAEFMSTTGGGSNFPEYAIHQLEMIVSVMGTGAKEVVCDIALENTLHFTITFEDGRKSTMTYNNFLPFSGAICGNGQTALFSDCSDIFPNMLEAMLQFYNGGEPPVKREETIAIAAMLDASIRASQNPGNVVAI